MALAIALFSVVQFRTDLFSLGLFELCLVLIASQAIYVVTRIAVHGRLCELAILATLTEREREGPYVRRVYNAMLRELAAKRGYKTLSQLGGWSGWLIWTAVWALPVLVIASYCHPQLGSLLSHICNV